MCNKPERGLTLIELLVFIVIIGIAATAILGVFGSLTRNSASLLPDKQAQAIASSMMNEILAQPFTFCDPDDLQAPVALNASSSPPGCTNASLVENLGPETVAGITETRGGARPFDNVNDYHSLAPPILASSLNNPLGAGVTPLAGLPGYTYQVTVAPTNALPAVPPADALLVTVTVNAPNGTMARLQGVRIRYTPNT